jgi:hypothetical protein
MLRARVVRHLASLFALLFVLFAAPRLARSEPGDELTVSVITMGPGDHPFYKFGHVAIWIHNAAASPRDPFHRDPVYNFGTFGMDGPMFVVISKFVQGRSLYWLSEQTIGQTKQGYRAENRSVSAQKLNLTAAQKKALLADLEQNALEENKYYKYDYYRDNCATRVRDAIDRVTGGQLKAASQGPAAMTWRQHTLRLTADDAVLAMALHVVMGNVIDRPLTQWEEMFLPAYVEQGLRRVKLKAADGTEIPLVQSEEVLVTANRPPLRSEPPSWGIWTLLAGLGMGGGLFGLGRAASKSLPARIGLGVLLFVAGSLTILGLLFVFAWVGTDHEVGYHNENILQLTPWCVGLMGFCFGVARLKPKAIARARMLVMAAAGASIFGLVWKVLPWMRQDNYWIIAFCAPMWIGATLGLRALEEAVGKTTAGKTTAAPGKAAVTKAAVKKADEPKKEPAEPRKEEPAEEPEAEAGAAG